MPRTKQEHDVVGGEKVAKQRSVRRQIRDTKRLLSRESLPETVKLTKERVLKSLHDELNEKLHEKRSKKLTKKYRRVKFFERVKVCKRLKQKVKEYKKRTDDVERAQTLGEVNQLRMELNYIDNFPPDEKYIALYPSTETTSTRALTRREEIFKQIVDMVSTGELPDATEKIPDLSCVLTSQEVVDRKGSCALLSRAEENSEDEIAQNVVSSVPQSRGRSSKMTQRTQRVMVTKESEDITQESDSESENDVQPSKRLKEDTFFLAEDS